MNSRDSVIESRDIRVVLDHVNVINGKEKIVAIDFDNTAMKLDKSLNKDAGGDAWYGWLLNHSRIICNNNLDLARSLVNLINDAVQEHIQLKPAEKETLDVVNALQESHHLPVIIVTARGHLLTQCTRKQLTNANFNFNRPWSQSLGNEPVKLHLDFDFYSLANFPDDPKQLNYKYSYVFSEESNKLFYFDRFGIAEEIKLTHPLQFKITLQNFLENKKYKLISQDDIKDLICKNSTHQPKERMVVYQNEMIFCDGQDKGKALKAFYKWMGWNLEETETLIVDDKRRNIEAVQQALNHVIGIHYTRISENAFNKNFSYEELARLYPSLPDQPKLAIQLMSLPRIPKDSIYKSALCLFATKNTNKPICIEKSEAPSIVSI